MHNQTKEWYQDHAQEYTGKIDGLLPLFQNELDQVILSVGPRAVVLDVGGAGGRDAAYFRSKGVEALNLDLVFEMNQASQALHPEVPVTNADFLSLPTADESVDGIWSHGSLLHLETIAEVEQALTEFYRVLRKGGHFWLKVKAQTGETETDVVTDTLSGHDRFFRYFSFEQLSRMLEQHGFSVVFHRQYAEGPGGRSEVEWLLIDSIKK
ncbi:class I SAM-dependent methyltransferase [Candidatus Woesebacteria bacterium]|nr:class I SAM-dependent methyltransferase [Candidatus Woesebacteria bacterium]